MRPISRVAFCAPRCAYVEYAHCGARRLLGPGPPDTQIPRPGFRPPPTGGSGPRATAEMVGLVTSTVPALLTGRTRIQARASTWLRWTTPKSRESLEWLRLSP